MQDSMINIDLMIWQTCRFVDAQESRTLSSFQHIRIIQQNSEAILNWPLSILAIMSIVVDESVVGNIAAYKNVPF